MLERGITPRAGSPSSARSGLACLVKATSYALLPGAASPSCWRSGARGRPLERVSCGSAAPGARRSSRPSVAGSWPRARWPARLGAADQRRHGQRAEPARARLLPVAVLSPAAAVHAGLLRHIPTLPVYATVLKGAWARFGWLEVKFPAPVYWLLAVVTVVVRGRRWSACGARAHGSTAGCSPSSCSSRCSARGRAALAGVPAADRRCRQLHAGPVLAAARRPRRARRRRRAAWSPCAFGPPPAVGLGGLFALQVLSLGLARWSASMRNRLVAGSCAVAVLALAGVRGGAADVAELHAGRRSRRSSVATLERGHEVCQAPITVPAARRFRPRAIKLGTSGGQARRSRSRCATRRHARSYARGHWRPDTGCRARAETAWPSASVPAGRRIAVCVIDRGAGERRRLRQRRQRLAPDDGDVNGKPVGRTWRCASSARRARSLPRAGDGRSRRAVQDRLGRRLDVLAARPRSCCSPCRRCSCAPSARAGVKPWSSPWCSSTTTAPPVCRRRSPRWRRGTRAEHEVIVVDSASSDGSWQSSNGARVLRYEDNIGFAAGCNRGAEAAAAPAGRLRELRRAGRGRLGRAAAARCCATTRAWPSPPACSSRPTARRLEAVGLEIAPNTATYGRAGGEPRAPRPPRRSTSPPPRAR